MRYTLDPVATQRKMKQAVNMHKSLLNRIDHLHPVWENPNLTMAQRDLLKDEVETLLRKHNCIVQVRMFASSSFERSLRFLSSGNNEGGWSGREI